MRWFPVCFGIDDELEQAILQLWFPPRGVEAAEKQGAKSEETTAATYLSHILYGDRSQTVGGPVSLIV